MHAGSRYTKSPPRFRSESSTDLKRSGANLSALGHSHLDWLHLVVSLYLSPLRPGEANSLDNSRPGINTFLSHACQEEISTSYLVSISWGNRGVVPTIGWGPPKQAVYATEVFPLI